MPASSSSSSSPRSPRRSRSAQLTDGPRLPVAPGSIAKGSTLTTLLDREAIDCLAHNLAFASPQFDRDRFRDVATDGLAPLSLMQRGHHLAKAMRACLPVVYEQAVAIIVRSLTPPLERTDNFGLAGFFYLPHVMFVSTYGLDPAGNGGADPFETSMRAQHELTRRFSAEFSIRAFLQRWPERTLAQLERWTKDSDPHVRRLCSEGTRPRLPWASRLPHFIRNPRPALPLLETLKDDADLYVRRSVANHLGDIAKDHPDLVFALCERWLVGAGAERHWLIRHAVRHPARKGVKAALSLRKRAR